MKTVQDIMAENGSLANIERFQTMQKWEYKRKVEHAQEMAEAFYYWAKEHEKGVHLSVGGLDSITLHYFLRASGCQSPVCPAHCWRERACSRYTSGSLQKWKKNTRDGWAMEKSRLSCS